MMALSLSIAVFFPILAILVINHESVDWAVEGYIPVIPYTSPKTWVTLRWTPRIRFGFSLQARKKTQEQELQMKKPRKTGRKDAISMDDPTLPSLEAAAALAAYVKRYQGGQKQKKKRQQLKAEEEDATLYRGRFLKVTDVFDEGAFAEARAGALRREFRDAPFPDGEDENYDRLGPVREGVSAAGLLGQRAAWSTKSEAARRRWRDPEYKARMLAARRKTIEKIKAEALALQPPQPPPQPPTLSDLMATLEVQRPPGGATTKKKGGGGGKAEEAARLLAAAGRELAANRARAEKRRWRARNNRAWMEERLQSGQELRDQLNNDEFKRERQKRRSEQRPRKHREPRIYNSGRWSTEEHRLFLEGLALHGKDWPKVADVVGTRSREQTYYHFWFMDETREKRRKKQIAQSKSRSYIGLNSGHWSKEEHGLFLKGLKEHGRSWKKIATVVGSRTNVQVFTHCQQWEKTQQNQGLSASFQFLELDGFYESNGSHHRQKKKLSPPPKKEKAIRAKASTKIKQQNMTRAAALVPTAACWAEPGDL